MTPKENAKYLISINSLAILSEIGNKLTIVEVNDIAKKFTLLEIDEILDNTYLTDYWQEVRKEIK